MLGPTGSQQVASDGSLADRIALRAGVVPRSRAIVAAALMSLALGAVLSQGLARERHPVAPSLRSGVASHKGLSSLPLTAQGPVSAALGADGPAYRVIPSRGGFQAANPAQGLHMSFSSSGVLVSSGGTQVGLSLRALGYGSSLDPLGQVPPRVRANRVLYERPGLGEWYVNGPLGLEQGFTIARAPAGHPEGALTLAIALSGDAHASLASGGQAITLSHTAGPTLRYSGLSATDAHGRALHGWLELHAGQVLLRVDTRNARYPLRIDPFIQQGARLTGSAEVGIGYFGQSVALSSDGNTALIGGPGDNSSVGAAWVFIRSGSTWTQQGSKLTGSGEGGQGAFGVRVALSSDGNTAIIGGSGDNSSVGAAWVFIRAGSTWTQQGSKLTGSGEGGKGAFGVGVALSSDGNTALIGGPEDNTEVGAAWVFIRAGSTWTQQGSKLTGSGEGGKGYFGWSVALSSDGNTALIGGPEDNTHFGAAWVFTRSGETWSQQGEKLTGSGEVGGGQFGYGVALSSDGNTALIGGPVDEFGLTEGAAWVFTRSGSTWTQQGAKLTGSGEVEKSQFGISVALSSDGNTALIGGNWDNTQVGAAWVFTRSGSTWTQQGPKLTGSGEVGAGGFGYVALSSDGNTALIGGPGDNSSVGAAWVFLNARRYYRDNVLIGAEPKTVISWGTVALKTVVGGSGEVTCRTAGAGTIDNPAGAGAGVGSTKVLATFACESTTCPFTSVVTAESLPWSSVLESEVSVIRAKTTGVKVKVDCQKEGTSESSETFVGADRPSFNNGTSALHPSFLEFDPGSGSLEKEGSGGGVLAKTEGENKILGYQEQELITVK